MSAASSSSSTVTLKPFDHSAKDRAAHWQSWVGEQLKPYLEKRALESLQKISLDKFTFLFRNLKYVEVTKK